MAAASLHDDVLPDSKAHYHSLVVRIAGARGDEIGRLHRVGWDATDRRNGGAERTVWETFA